MRESAFDAFIDDSPFEEDDLTVIRTKNIDLRPESVDEAILNMNRVGHKFYMFLNADNGKICVVYVRNDGGYGLLEPDID